MNQFMLEEWGSAPTIDQLLVGDTAIVELDARVDLAGGWSDTPPYYFKNRSAVLNTTIAWENDRHIRPIRIIVSQSPKFRVVENGAELNLPLTHMVIKTVLEFLKLENPPILIEVVNNIPHGSGLGGSSLYALGVLAAILSYYHGSDSVMGNLDSMINYVLIIEQMMGSGGGWQDQVGGAVPGMKLIETSPDSPCRYRIRHIDGNVVERLSQQSLLINTGVLRKASTVLGPIRERYVAGEPAVVSMLASIRNNAISAFEALRRSKIAEFAGIMGESWKEVVAVEEASTIPFVGRFEDVCGSDVAGFKIGGAGGGGFLLAVYKSSEAALHWSEKLESDLVGCKVLIPKMGVGGIRIHQGSVECPRVVEL